MKLIGVTGFKGSGKDAIGDIMCQKKGYMKFAFAAPVKSMAYVLLQNLDYTQNDILLALHGSIEQKEKQIPGLVEGVTPRRIMQILGTETRDLLDRNLWTKILEIKLQKLPACTSVVICDVRFEHEVEMIQKLGGKIIKVIRPGVDLLSDHASETEIPHLHWDAVIHNDGTLDDLKEKVFWTLNFWDEEEKKKEKEEFEAILRPKDTAITIWCAILSWVLLFFLLAIHNI